jgi:hypothetical protein
MSSEIGNEDTWRIDVAIAQPIEIVAVELRGRLIREGGFHFGVSADAANRGACVHRRDAGQ